MQGLFIFLFHVARHEKVWGKIKTKLPKRKVYIITTTDIIITVSNYGYIQLF